MEASLTHAALRTRIAKLRRRLIADAVELLDPVGVVHPFHDGRILRHPPMTVARVDGGRLVSDRIVDSEGGA